MIELLPLSLPYCKDVYEIAKESLPEYWSLNAIEEVLRYENNIYYIACEKNPTSKEYAVVGFAGIMVIMEEAELLNIAVTNTARSCGVGSLLLQKMIEQADKKGAQRLLLEVRKSNEVAIHLYLKNDFSQLGVRRNYYSNPTEDALILERWLNNKRN